ncbi:protein of unknown function [Micropruina glycogenica]|uniref:Uncharacterized protein n=1 Tax=Micropruina glycogenica TaxID=75385 RepID=A0A2N9JGT4_9ACTN|nr:protein of unknown function [Micropruina glycogenica]
MVLVCHPGVRSGFIEGQHEKFCAARCVVLSDEAKGRT